MDDFGGFIHCVLPADQLIGPLAVEKTSVCSEVFTACCWLGVGLCVCTLCLAAGKSAKCKDDIETTSLKKEPRNASRVIVNIFWIFDI
jgi:hypothetical protein